MLLWANLLRPTGLWCFSFGYEFDANKAIKEAWEPRLKRFQITNAGAVFPERAKDVDTYGYELKPA